MRISDWSSDVCSSDLGLGITGRPERLVHSEPRNIFWGRVIHRGTDTNATDYILYAERPLPGLIPVAQPTPEMATTPTPAGHRDYAMPWSHGRAACRERVCQYW